MTTYSWPEQFGTVSMEWGIKRSRLHHRNPLTEHFQEIDLLGWAWMVDVVLPSKTYNNSAAVEGFFNGLVGSGDTVLLYQLVRPVPIGTMRGSPVLASALAQFANSISITTTAGATLKAGDYIGVGAQLFQVRFDAVANGAGLMSVMTVNRSRKSVASGAAVSWNKPTAEFTVTDEVTKFAFARRRVEGAAFALQEVPR